MRNHSDESQNRMLAAWLETSRFTLVLTGAGMSTESGVPDFRSSNGLWQNQNLMDLISPEGLERDFETFTRFYRWRLDTLRDCRPNEGHRILTDWESFGLVRGIVTQNVDGLHQFAGSRNVVALHGDIRTVRCQACGKEATADAYRQEGQEICPCGGKRRPNVVMFGESLPAGAIDRAIALASKAELMLVLGSSLAVSPANHLPLVAQGAGALVAIVNATETAMDGVADAVIRAPIGATLQALDRAMRRRG